jgi:hypothetical protein
MPLSSGSAARATLLLAPLLLLAGCGRTIVDASVSAEVRGRLFRAGLSEPNRFARKESEGRSPGGKRPSCTWPVPRRLTGRIEGGRRG